jgi:hypothetical protein
VEHGRADAWFGVVWGCQSGIVAGPTTVGIFLLVTGKSLLTGLGMLIAGVLGGLAGLVAIAFLMELGLRPMLEDVARCLPPEFEPGARAWRLQAKALAPLHSSRYSVLLPLARMWIS